MALTVVSPSVHGAGRIVALTPIGTVQRLESGGFPLRRSTVLVVWDCILYRRGR